MVEKRWESKVFEGLLMCLDVFGREIRERGERKNQPRNYPEIIIIIIIIIILAK